MEQFNKDIKNTMQKRRIQPSEDAWTRMEALLDADDKRKVKPLFYWIGIAATVAILAAVVTYTFVVTTPVIEDQQLVDVDTDQAIEKIIIQPEERLEKEEIEVVETPVINNAIEKTPAPVVKSNSHNSNNKQVLETSIVVENNPVVNQILEVTQPQQESIVVAVDSAYAPAVLTVETPEVITAITSTESLDDEVDKLLKQARERLKNTPEQPSIDAISLLESVEYDMERTFRDRLFNTITTQGEKLINATVMKDQ